MARNWTPAQTAAMSTLGRTLLVSAAAGSGKTATLTERIIRRLTDSEHPADLSRMLIVTFTRAAAAELKERISAALSAAIEKDPGNRHLQNQLIGLGGAHISTIDAFYREPVKANFARLGLPAASRIADDAELLPLCESVMDGLIREFYLRYASSNGGGSTFGLLQNNPFADLCDSLSPSKNDQELIHTFLNLYNRLLSFPQELERLREEAEILEAHALQDFFTTDHGRVIHEWVTLFATSAEAAAEKALDDILAYEPAIKPYAGVFEADLDFYRALKKADSYGEAFGLMASYTNQRLGPLRQAPAHLTAHKELRTETVKAVKKLRALYFTDDSQTISSQMKDTSRLCLVLYQFLKEYDRRILNEKQNRGICDFTDNRRYLLSLLKNEDGSPSGLALDFQRMYDEVYIDEYQDVDEMQDEIFRLVGDDHRFMVGDIKQSIYGFRGADPSVFAGYRKSLPPLYRENGVLTGHAPGGNSIFMSENFRCDPSVIRITNAICGHMFRACPDSVGYVDGDDLVCGKIAPDQDYVSPPVQISVLYKPAKGTEDDREAEADDPEDGEALSGAQSEAKYVAGLIADLLNSGQTLADGTPILPKDIVILMRSRTALPAFMEALTAKGIPTGSEELAAEEAGRDLLHGSDMSYLINLLRVLDDPDNDIPLSEVLRAPFPGLTLEELIAVRGMGDTESESHSLFMGLEEYLEQEDKDPLLGQKITDFLAWLEKYRRLTATQPADKLLRLLRRDPNCAARTSPAFLYLYESARTCQTASFLSLYAFLRYFESKLATAKNAPATEQNAAKGCVSIMTIHKSKGLEFPVCFVVRCGQAFSTQSVSGDMIFEKHTGIAMKLYHRVQEDGILRQYKTDTTLRAASALAVKLSEREEEMRLLYVAMTRARERLYLVGTGNQKEVSFPCGDRYATLSCNSYLKWILGGLAAHSEVANAYCLNYVSTSELPDTPPLKLQAMRTMSDTDSKVAAHYREILTDRPSLAVAEQVLRDIPTKLPASRMQKNLLDTCVFFETDLEEDDGKLPDSESGGVRCDTESRESVSRALALMEAAKDNEFELLLQANRRPTAAERGTAVHLFLQYCHFPSVACNGPEQEIQRLLEEGFINQRTADILDRGMIRSFFASQFFARLQTAKNIRRELKFSRFVPLASLTSRESLAKALGDRTLYVQGSIDLLLEFPDGHLELCDYKTDRITSEERRDPSLLRTRLTHAHRGQMAEYAAAVSERYGKAPERLWVFSMSLGEALEISVEDDV